MSRKNVVLERREDVPENFLQAYDEACGVRGEGRRFLIQVLKVGMAIKDADSWLFRLITSMADEHGNKLNLNQIEACIQAARSLSASEPTASADSKPAEAGASETASKKDQKNKKPSAAQGFGSQFVK